MQKNKNKSCLLIFFILLVNHGKCSFALFTQLSEHSLWQVISFYSFSRLIPLSEHSKIKMCYSLVNQLQRISPFRMAHIFCIVILIWKVTESVVKHITLYVTLSNLWTAPCLVRALSIWYSMMICWMGNVFTEPTIMFVSDTQSLKNENLSQTKTQFRNH